VVRTKIWNCRDKNIRVQLQSKWKDRTSALGSRTDDMESYRWKPVKMVLVFLPHPVGRSNNDQEALWMFTILHGNGGTTNPTVGRARSNLVSRNTRKNIINSRINRL